MRSWHYVRLDPTGNITLLVTDPVKREEQPALAARMMQDPSIKAEQVGFLETPVSASAQIRLQMMGGEFCGNATVSTAAWLLSQETGIPEKTTVMMEVSGADHVLACELRRLEDGFEGTVEMPGIREISSTLLPWGGLEYPVTLVRMEGIVHIVTEQGLPDNRTAERMLRSWAGQFEEDAAGLLQWDEARQFMTPLVFVKETDTMVWETGCGSGSTAIGSMKALSAGEGTHETEVRQPGGTIRIHAGVRNGKVECVRMTGFIRLLNSGVYSENEQ